MKIPSTNDKIRERADGRKTSSMRRLILIDELSLIRFLWLAWIGRKPDILRIVPIIPSSVRILEAVVMREVRAGRARYVIDEFPELRPFWDYDRRFHFHEACKKYEPWQETYYRFADADAMGSPYGLGFKQLVTCLNFQRMITIYLLDAYTKKYTPAERRIHGVGTDLLDMCRAYFDTEAVPGVSPRWMSAIFVNLVLVLIVTGTAVAWTISRTRPVVKRNTVFFAADFNGDSDEFTYIDEVADGGEVLVVARTPDFLGMARAAGRSYRSVSPSDGRLDFRDSVVALGLLIRDTLGLASRHLQLTPELFFRVLMMPFRRIVVRAFLRRFPSKYFWGRDDYNVEHILRHDELKRVGGTSLGYCHAVPTNFCSVIPQIRYVSFDIYYTYGALLCKPYLRTWPKEMALRSSGLIGPPREFIMDKWPQGETVLFATRVAWHEPELQRMIHAVAEAFPGKRILVQIKPGYLSSAAASDIFVKWQGDIANVEPVEDRIYNLLPKCRYLISDVSTLIGEALQLGIPTLFADVIDMEYTVYREFPGLAVKSSDELVERLRALDSGVEEFPHKEYLRIMGLDHGRISYDLLREDVGLPPLETPGMVPHAETHDGKSQVYA